MMFNPYAILEWLKGPVDGSFVTVWLLVTVVVAIIVTETVASK